MKPPVFGSKPPTLKPTEARRELTALDLSAHELELIAIVTGWQKRSPRKITTAALRRMKAKKETKEHNPSQAVLESSGQIQRAAGGLWTALAH